MAEIVNVALTLFSALLAAAVAAGIGYLKTLPPGPERFVKWDWRKFLRTVVLALLLVLFAVLLGLPIATPGPIVALRLEDIGVFAGVVFIADQLALLIWRRLVLPFRAEG